jgi:hypothetical protein
VELSPATAQDQDHKITICHVPPGNPGNSHLISIDLHAWETGHSPENSEDFIVDADHPCQVDDGGTTTTSSTSTTSTTVQQD